MNLSRAITQSEVFRDLPETAIERLEALATERAVPKGDVLFAQDQPGTAFFLLARGAIKLYRAEDGREVVIRMVRPGEMFGEAVVFGSATYPVYAEAVRPSVTVEIPVGPLLRLLDDHDFRDQFIRALIGRLRYLVDHIHILSIPFLEDRFLRFLEYRYGRRTHYELDLSRKDVAAALGVTAEAFSRMLRRLRDSGIARWEGRTLSVSPSAWESDE
jgi:CRP/FNR family transcriptional regulator